MLEKKEFLLFYNIVDPDPTPIFFYEGAKKILKYLNIDFESDENYMKNIMSTDFWRHDILSQPILLIVKKVLDLKFNDNTEEYIYQKCIVTKKIPAIDIIKKDKNMDYFTFLNRY